MSSDDILDKYKLKFNPNVDDRICSLFCLHYPKAAENIDWRSWFYFIDNLYYAYGLETTHALLKGNNYPTNSVKIRSYKGIRNKLEKNGFNGINNLSLSVLHREDIDTTNFIADSILNNKDDVQFSVANINIDQKILPFNLSNYLAIYKKLIEISNCKYGYLHTQHLGYMPESYIYGKARSETIEELRLQQNWNNNNDEKYSDIISQFGKLRDVYKLNILSIEHLSYPVPNGLNLSIHDLAHKKELNSETTTKLYNWIKAQPYRGKVIRFMEGRYCWYFESDADIEKTRNELKNTELLIAFITEKRAKKLCHMYNDDRDFVNSHKVEFAIEQFPDIEYFEPKFEKEISDQPRELKKKKPSASKKATINNNKELAEKPINSADNSLLSNILKKLF